MCADGGGSRPLGSTKEFAYGRSTMTQSEVHLSDFIRFLESRAYRFQIRWKERPVVSTKPDLFLFDISLYRPVKSSAMSERLPDIFGRIGR